MRSAAVDTRLHRRPSTDTATATTPGSPGGRAIVPSTVAGATVLVTITDERIVVANPDQIPPGPARLVLKPLLYA